MVETMSGGGDHGGSEEEFLLTEMSIRGGGAGGGGGGTGGGGDVSWRLNFDGFQLSSEHKEKPPRGLHDCLGVLVPEDNVAEYYQQQVETLEGFTEMDELAERGFVPRLSAVGVDYFDF
ncbi:hypothetical protein Hanom_Chr09g00798601 [Helianthus anomalus]